MTTVRLAGTGQFRRRSTAEVDRHRRPRHHAGQLSVAAQAPFADWRVLELSNGIAVSYCGKMFADAGADVVKIESPQGDSLRDWSAGGPPGALFGYLAAGKKSVVGHDGAEIASLLAGADIVLTDLTDGWTLDDITAHTGPSAVVVAVTPFGTDGSVRRRPCGRQRVHPAGVVRLDRRPRLAGRRTRAGGRPARRVVGGLRSPRPSLPPRPGTPPGAAAGRSSTSRRTRRWSSRWAVCPPCRPACWVRIPFMQQRSLELPSIVPTADGMVGFCTITAQQFQDFLVMIDRADLVDDAELASFAGRIAASRRIPRHGHPMDGDPHHAGGRRARGGVSNPGGPHSNPRRAAQDRPLRRTRRLRRIRARGAAAAGAVSQRRHQRPGRRDRPPVLGADNGRVQWPPRPGRPSLPTPTHFHCPTYG